MSCPDASQQNVHTISDGVDMLTPSEQARQWWEQFGAAITDTPMGQSVIAPANATAALAEFAALALQHDKSLLILVPDDEFLPEFSSALDIGLRPLCLVLPSADFAARIAMRATLSLLKSRLSRDADDTQEHIWAQQHLRIKTRSDCWQTAQAWNGSSARSDWPPATPQLFPVRILPVAAFRSQPRMRADLAVCYCCDPGTDAAWLGDRLLFVGERTGQTTRQSLAFVDETARLSIELAQLTQDVGELELELATAQAEMTDFTRRYYGTIGRRMAELDVLRAKLARHQLDALSARTEQGSADNAAVAADNSTRSADTARDHYEHLRRQAERSQEESARFEQADREFACAGEPRPFRPDAHIKRQFRQLAQRIHPDRAVSEQDRTWRTQLMSEANRAYRAGDRQGLDEVAALWEEGAPHQHLGLQSSGITTPQDLLRRQIATMRERFDTIRQELHRLFGSKLYEIFLAARQIKRFGRDLLQEMSDRLDAQIGDVLAALRAMGCTEAILWNGTGEPASL